MHLRHLLLLSSRTCFRLHPLSPFPPCRTVLLVLLQSERSRHPISCLSQRYSSSSSGDDKKTPSSKSILGEKENKGLGEQERPYFSPEEAKEPLEPAEEPLSAPTNCCRSGCPNCVWVEYVEKLTERYLNPELSRERILKELEDIDDQSIKAFIKLELKSRGLI